MDSGQGNGMGMAGRNKMDRAARAPSRAWGVAVSASTTAKSGRLSRRRCGTRVRRGHGGVVVRAPRPPLRAGRLSRRRCGTWRSLSRRSRACATARSRRWTPASCAWRCAWQTPRASCTRCAARPASDRRGARVPCVSRVAGRTVDRNEGRSMPCRHCDGSGRVVTCLECACDVAAPEAEEMGHHCARCRADLDRAAE